MLELQVGFYVVSLFSKRGGKKVEEMIEALPYKLLAHARCVA